MAENEVLEYIKQSFDLKSKGLYKQAIEMLYKALEIENDNIELLFQLGELYFLLNNYPRAIQYVEKISKVNPNHEEALKLSEKIYLRENRFDKAKDAALKIFELQKKSENLSDLILILSKMKDIDAIKNYESSEYADDSVKLSIASAYFDNSNYDASKNILETINEKNNIDVKVLLGKVYFNENNFDKSREIFESFDNNIQNAEVLNFKGIFAVEDMKFIDAIKYFSKAVNLNNQNDRYLFNLANAYFYNGWFDESAQTYQKAICLNPENVDYRYSLAYLYYEEKSFDKARKEVDVILEKNDKYSQAIVLDALLKMEDKDLLGAQVQLENNLKNYPEDKFTKSSLVKVYQALGLYEKAKRIINELLTYEPENLTYLSDMCEILIGCKEFDEAIKFVEKMKQCNENYIETYILGAKAAFEKQDYELAKYFAQEAISLDMNCAAGYYYLALVRFSTADCDEAIECMKRAIMHDLNNPLYYAKMSEIYKVQGDLQSAIEYIKEAESISGATEYKLMYSELVSLNRKSKKLNKV